jgi:hypothetical protein
MDADTRRGEHQRLQKRTDELKHEHDELALNRTPFNQADHDGHSAELRKHSEDLRKHRQRLNRDET